MSPLREDVEMVELASVAGSRIFSEHMKIKTLLRVSDSLVPRVNTRMEAFLDQLIWGGLDVVFFPNRTWILENIFAFLNNICSVILSPG